MGAAPGSRIARAGGPPSGSTCPMEGSQDHPLDQLGACHMSVRLGDPLTTGDVLAVARYGARVQLGAGVAAIMEPARRLIEEVVSSQRTVYGVTTGFGYLANVHIPANEAADLQRDIVLSHATGVGDE